MREFPCYLYHICREEDKYDFSKGYIGISRKPTKRWSSGGYKSNPHLGNAFQKYDDIIHYVIKLGTRSECLRDEMLLRPFPNTGWNIAPGGSAPPSPKLTGNCISRIPLEKRRRHYRCSEKTKKKISEANLRRSKEHSERMLGDKNPMHGVTGKDRPTFQGFYITPAGRFETSREVERVFDISKPTVQRRCKVGGMIKHNRWTPREWVGKSWEELGWGFEYKEVMSA